MPAMPEHISYEPPSHLRGAGDCTTGSVPYIDRHTPAMQTVRRLRRSGWTVAVWGSDAARGVLFVDGLEPGGTFAQGYGFRGEIDRFGNMTSEPMPPEGD